MKFKPLVIGILIVLTVLSVVACAQAPATTTPTPTPSPKPSPTPTPSPSPTTPAAPQYTWKLSADEIEGDFGSVYGHYFADALAEISKGRIKVDVYPFGTLGDITDTIELTISGGIQFHPMTNAWISDWVPEVNVLLLHYLLPGNTDALLEAMNGGQFFNIMKDLYAAQGLKLFNFTTYGWMWWTSNKPLKTLADFKNVNFRVMASPMLVETYKAYGANPTPLPFGEVYTGLQLGTIHAEENPLITIDQMKFYEVQDYITNGFTAPFTHSPTANLKFYQSLPKDVQAMVDEAVKVAADKVKTWGIGTNAKEKDIMLKQKPKLVFYELTPDEQKPFIEKAKSVYSVYLTEKVGGKNAKQVLDALTSDVDKVKAKYGIK